MLLAQLSLFLAFSPSYSSPYQVQGAYLAQGKYISKRSQPSFLSQSLSCRLLSFYFAHLDLKISESSMQRRYPLPFPLSISPHHPSGFRPCPIACQSMDQYEGQTPLHHSSLILRGCSLLLCYIWHPIKLSNLSCALGSVYLVWHCS